MASSGWPSCCGRPPGSAQDEVCRCDRSLRRTAVVGRRRHPRLFQDQAGILDLERTEFRSCHGLEDVFGLMLPLVDRQAGPAAVDRIAAIAERRRRSRQAPADPAQPGRQCGQVHRTRRMRSRSAKSLPGERRCCASKSATPASASRRQAEAIFDPFTQSDAFGRATVRRQWPGAGDLPPPGRPARRRNRRRQRTRRGQPLLVHHAARLAQTRRPRRQSAARRGPKRAPVGLELLVVEDNEVNAMVAAGLLDRAGHNATIAATGAEALALFDAAPFRRRVDGSAAARLRRSRIGAADAGVRRRQKRRIPIIVAVGACAGERH